MRYSPYFRLMRLHQPTGIWLLLWPCWWSLALAAEDFPPFSALYLFALGAVLMRASGCIINDICDREFDRHVERTRDRPLASGELSLTDALVLLAALLLCSLGIALLLGPSVVWWALLALPLVVTYPLMKRISWWPQLFLGFTFNWGALMGWAALQGAVGGTALVLYAGCLFWTLGYDTLYAHQDATDDRRIGVRSTALRLGGKTKPFVGLCYLLAVGLWSIAAWMAGHSVAALLWFAPALLHLLWQVYTVRLDEPASCRRMFTSNRHLGWLVWAAFLI